MRQRTERRKEQYLEEQAQVDVLRLGRLADRLSLYAVRDVDTLQSEEDGTVLS